MAARLGLAPWDRDRLQPAEIWELYDGMMWRHSRQIELVAIQTMYIRTMMSDKDRLDDILQSFPYYRRDEGF